MPNPQFYTSESQTFAELNTPASAEIKQLIANIQNSHRLRYKMMNLEAWALAETMDRFLPGFWSRFLENRRQSLQQFLERKRTSSSETTRSSSTPSVEE